MKKILVPALILILTVTVFTGCLNSQSGPNIPIDPNAPVASQEPTVDTSDPSTVVLVTVGGTENVYMSEFITLWDTYCYQYGIDKTILNDPAYKEDLNALQKQLINSLIGEKILFLKLTELGYYDLTPTEIKEAEDAKEALIANYITTYEDEITADLDEDYTDIEYNMAVLEYRFELLESWNMTEEGLLEFQKGEIASNNAQVDLIPDPQPSNEQLVELYNNKVASDQESLAENPSMYEMYVLNYGYAPYYTPGGYRNIKQILIILSDETIDQIKDLDCRG